uniref:hypothetical protein n=1 Tax=uncultured Acidovorax sp. TaxID=158751 RepID=UPI0025D368BE|nr:hypothetical protein [uncultured Acidovorax sp.]
MQMLDLINPYPIHERLIQAPWDSEGVVEAARRKLRTIRRPDELARLMAQSHGDNAMPNALHDSLEANLAYKAAKDATPFLKDSPAIARYRKMYGRHDVAAVISEIFDAEVYLPAGQVLFHGGPWPESNGVPPVDARYTTQQPLSATLCPQVAAVHSYYEPRGFLWNISLTNPTPCFVFDNKNRVLGHEYEVLLPPLEIVCTSVEIHGLNTPLIHVSAFRRGVR